MTGEKGLSARRWPVADSGFAAAFCWPPRRFVWARPVMVVFRSVHVAAMALVLGGLAFGVAPARLTAPALVAVASGVGLLAVELLRSAVFLYQGAGLLVAVKLALLGLGHLDPDWLYPCYLAATVVASVGSHMTARLRHYSLVDRCVLEAGPRR